MALNRTHSIIESPDSMYITVKDTTTLADYVANGINDPVATVTLITFTITDNTSETTSTVTLTSSAADLRDSGGVKIYATTLGIGDVFLDDLWHSTMSWTIGSVYTSTDDSFLYNTVKNKVVVSCLNTDWKVSFDMNSRDSNSKNSTKLKSWMDKLVMADENNLLEEGKSILETIKSLV